MFEKIGIMEMAQSLARHASARQTSITQNVAHADTPGYRAKDVADFSEVHRANSGAGGLRTTRASHELASQDRAERFDTFEVAGPSSPNGNTVSLENEMLKASEVRLEHDMALSVYQTSLNILRSSLGRGR